jgi:hypothetical protein
LGDENLPNFTWLITEEYMLKMFTFFFALTAFNSAAIADSSVACFQPRSNLSVQLSVSAESDSLTVTFAEVSENDFHLLDFMHNSKIGASDFSQMVKQRQVNIRAYPEGQPDEGGRWLQVLINGNNAEMVHEGETYLFDRCDWSE